MSTTVCLTDPPPDAPSGTDAALAGRDAPSPCETRAFADPRAAGAMPDLAPATVRATEPPCVATVVIPSYGRPRKLLACLEALAGQTFAEPWEVVVVDDGSPEPVEPTVAGRFPNLRLRIVRQENAGPASARNRGVEAARGDVVAFTDDDCLPDPGWLEALVRALREPRYEHALVGGVTFNGLDGDHCAMTSHLILELVYDHFNADPNHAYFFASNNVACRRARFLELGGFDVSFPRAGGEDRDFCDLWRMRGWPIVWRPSARIEHRHAQTLRTFIDVHVRYGRGAYLYQAKRRARGSGTMGDDLGFHRSLGTRVSRRLRALPGVDARARVVILLAVWQAANLLGFLMEALDERRRELADPPHPRASA